MSVALDATFLNCYFLTPSLALTPGFNAHSSPQTTPKGG